MNGCLMIGKWNVSISAVAFLLFLWALNRNDYFFLMLFAALLHEIGHVIAIWMFGLHIREVRITPCGAVIAFDQALIRYTEEMVICSVGPAANLSAAVTGILLQRYFPDDRLLFFIFVNLVYAAFNLLPVTGLDGGGFLRALLCQKSEDADIESRMRKISAVFVALLFVLLMLLLVFFEFNLSFAAVSLSLLLRLKSQNT